MRSAQVILILVVVLLSACAPVRSAGTASPSSSSPVPSSPTDTTVPTSIPTLDQVSTELSPLSPATPASTVPSSPPSPPPGWAWYQSHYAGYTIAHPQSWESRPVTLSGRSPGQALAPPRTDVGPIRERISFYSPETGSMVGVDVWDVTAQTGFDLLEWVSANPERVLWSHPGEPVTYNARILGYPAIFYYKPAAWGTWDTSMLIFADGEYCFRVTFISQTTPTLETEAAIYLQMLESFSLPDSPAGELAIPTGWERGAGLVSDTAPSEPGPADLPPDELLPYRQGLAGNVEACTPLLPLPGHTLTFATDDGQRYTVHVGPFRHHFHGLPLDYQLDVQMPEIQEGDRVRVAGHPLDDGSLLAEHIAVDQSAGWQTWFQKTLFDLTRGEFDPALLVHYSHDEDVMLWLRGPLDQVLDFVTDQEGEPLGSQSFSGYLERNTLAQGALRARDGFRVELERLYVQGEGKCTVSGGREHCPIWLQLYPPVSVTTTITGTVLGAMPEAGIIVLARPVEGFVTITLLPEGQLLAEDKRPVAWEEVVAEVCVQASGIAGVAGTLLAQEIHLTSLDD